MRTITLIDLHSNPDLAMRLEAAARRERARYIGGLVGRAVAYLFHREPVRAARTRLAGQG